MSIGWAAIGAAAPPASAAVLFSQDFSSSTTVSSYVGAPPDAGQFDEIGRTGASTTVSITSGALQYVRSGNIGFFTRSTDFAPAPAFLLYQFDLALSGNVNAQTTAATWYIGQDMPAGGTTPTNASHVYARIALNFTNTGGVFQLRHLDTDGAGDDASINSGNFSGTQTIRWYVNNSGAALAYAGPGGSAASVGDDRYDLWVGQTLVFDDFLPQSPALSLTDLKFLWVAGTGTLRIDNMVIESLPVPDPAGAGAGAMTLLLGAGAMGRRR